MKKWIAVLLAVVLLFACGCKKNEVEEPVVQPTLAPAATPTPTPEPVATPTPTPSQEPVEENYTYTSEQYGFTITMPADWKDCCIIEDSGSQISFYSAANRYFEYEGEKYDCGHLFTIMVPDASLKEDGGYVFPSYEIIGQIDGSDILVVYPTDVQIADIDNAEASAEYNRMYEEVSSVLATITFG